MTGAEGLDSRGVPITIPKSLIGELSEAYYRRRQNGNIPVDMTFLDFVSILPSEARQE